MSTKKIGAYLEITMKINDLNREAAASVYTKYREPFLTTIEGAVSKELLLRDEDVQVLHGFTTAAHAEAYLTSELFNADVVVELKPYFEDVPCIKIYTVIA